MRAATPKSALGLIAALLLLGQCTPPPPRETCLAHVQTRLADSDLTLPGDIADVVFMQHKQTSFETTLDLFSANTAGGQVEIVDPGTGQPFPILPGVDFSIHLGIHSLSDIRLKAVGRTPVFSCRSGEEPDVPLYVGAANRFDATATHAGKRVGATASALGDGRVLIVGGDDGNGQPAAPIALLYDHDTGVFCSGDCGLSGTLPTARVGHTATTLPDGTVVLVGGREVDDADSAMADAFVFDPSTNAFSTFALVLARREHSAVYLPDAQRVAAARRGRVLVCGGRGPGQMPTVYDDCLAFDPRTGNADSIAGMQTARYQTTAAYLSSGQVLLAGGRDQSDALLSSAELFDAGDGTFATVLSACTGQNPGMCAKRAGHTASVLDDDGVLLWGGQVEALGPAPPPQAEVFLLAPSEVFLAASSNADTQPARIGHAAVRIRCVPPPSCPVLIIGGINPQSDIAVAPVLYAIAPPGFDATAAVFYNGTITAASTSPALAERMDFAAAPLVDGAIVLVGGAAPILSGQAVESAALFSYCSANRFACPPL